jgi:hypothetical protein
VQIIVLFRFRLLEMYSNSKHITAVVVQISREAIVRFQSDVGYLLLKFYL